MMRIDARIAIVESDCETDVDDPVRACRRPTSRQKCENRAASPGCGSPSRREAIVGHLPQFFNSDRVDLRVAVAVEFQAVDQLLGKRTAHSLTENSHFGNDIDSRFVVAFGSPFLSMPLSPVRTPMTDSPS